MNPFSCQFCGLRLISDYDLNQHISNRHRNLINVMFRCLFPGCGQTFSTFDSLKKHKNRSHVFCSLPVTLIADDCDLVEDEGLLSQSDIKSIVGHFLLKIRANHRLSDVGSADLAANLEQLLNDYSSLIKRQIVDELRSNVSNIEDVLNSSPQLVSLLTPTGFCSDFRTVRMQNRYIQNHFGLVEPVAIKLGEKIVRRRIWKENKFRLTTVNCYGYYVPLLESLAALLRMPEVAHEILNAPPRDDEFMRDICDGQFCLHHPILSDSRAIRLISYHDEFNLTNPLGVHVKSHKLLIFYYFLGNIRPELRSKLSSIQLLAIARSADIKNNKDSLNLLLKDFVGSLNSLRTGVDFQVGTVQTKLRGALAAHLADTPANQQIGKFVEGVAKAIKPCRYNIRII